jgi:hypothetical protein
MSRGKSVTKLLLDSSQAALFAGIEIHNKPHIDYRYPTSVILIVNAWELALKAYVYKYIGKKKIYEKDGKHTISFSRALIFVRDHINATEKNKKFAAIFDNLFLLNEYRCSNVHFIETKLDPVIFMLISKSVLNYDVFVKKYFKKDITRDDNLIILPIGLKLPFDPIDYLKQNYNNVHNDFINNVIQSVRELNSDGVQDSIVVGFNLVTDKVRDVKNADIIAALSNTTGDVVLRREIRITDNPSAPLVRVEPDIPPLRYADLRMRAKEKEPKIKFGKVFNLAMKMIKADKALCQVRYLDPKNKSGLKTEFFDERAIDALIQAYNELEAPQ